MRPPDWAWVEQRVAAQVFPLGLISETRVQLRAAGLRNDSTVFRDSHFGAGVRVAVTPAVVDAGADFSLAPVDVFHLQARVGVVGAWPGSSSILPYQSIHDGTHEKHRLLALLLAGAEALRRLPGLATLGIPACFVAGVAGLLLGPEVAALLPLDVGVLEATVQHGLAAVLIAVGLQSPGGGPGGRDAAP